MKKIYLLLVLATAIGINSCKKNNYAEGSLSPIIAVVDLKGIYKGSDVVLNSTNMGGAKEIVGVVISNAAAGNSPAGVLVVQNNRRNAVRGISLEIGNAAANYVPGDSVIVQVEGATLTKVNGSMRVKGLTESSVNKVATNKAVKVQSVPSATLLASPDVYEGTLVTIAKAVTDPEPQQGETYAGDKTLNDGFGKIIMHTEANAAFATTELPFSANFTGIPLVITSGTDTKMQLWPRTIDDVFTLAATKPSPIIITGYLTNPSGSDADYEYIQFKATKDIDFAVTNYAVVTCNNAGTNPAPANGWAQGLAKTYKFNLTSGTVKKGQFFYVGGNKNIWGKGSTDISSSNWINSTMYAEVPGADFGNVTTNLLANSGNVAGVSVFAGTTVSAASVPLDVIMYGGGGTVYSAGPPEIGYRITNTDYYSTINPVTRTEQGFYGGGSNTSKLPLPTDGLFSQLGGVYDALTGRWVAGRTVTSVPLTLTSPISTIETATGATTIQN
ncbi:DUF5689 domain-containing protein [Mucilaginibacter gossypii]|uniref:DUF5689 domain-containing protein n=1 Tax=Mucilaginibacter gossypii TaxID=551996 RepID=UPI000DCB41FE|nr:MULTISPECIES: DUF5689 domain-containing protein [Mucilaginibacter]QTE39603.1 DUF5689 domain-containing protein [Mucilaginibacter gossypii]RAV53982.1 hypothetical protein DIU36_21820 [Mucilaginibacter rubeus]